MTSDTRQWLVLPALLAAAFAHAEPPSREESAPTVVFVCEHGSVKSLMASEYFNRAAAERRLPFRSISRGIQPDERVPDRILDRLREEGHDASAFRPSVVEPSDVAHAARVVAIGVDPDALPKVGGAAVEQWDDVPPASADYAAARRSLQEHVNALLDELADGARTAP